MVILPPSPLPGPIPGVRFAPPNCHPLPVGLICTDAPGHGPAQRGPSATPTFVLFMSAGKPPDRLAGENGNRYAVSHMGTHGAVRVVLPCPVSLFIRVQAKSSASRTRTTQCVFIVVQVNTFQQPLTLRTRPPTEPQPPHRDRPLCMSCGPGARGDSTPMGSAFPEVQLQPLQ